MKKLATLILVVAAAAAQAQPSATIFGGTDDSVGGAVAWQLEDRTAEVGIHVVEESVGIHGALQMEHLLSNVVAPETALPFAGFAVLYDTDAPTGADEWWQTGFAGFLFKPKSEISPVTFGRYDWNRPGVTNDASLWFGLRVALK